MYSKHEINSIDFIEEFKNSLKGTTGYYLSTLNTTNLIFLLSILEIQNLLCLYSL